MPASAAAQRVSGQSSTLLQASAVAIGHRALILEGEPGAGKSTLALALIDRGARLIGDDGVMLEDRNERLLASSPPHTSGLLEVRGVGLMQMPTAEGVPVSLILSLGEEGPRLPETSSRRNLLGISIPSLAFEPGTIAPAVRAEKALAKHGLAFP